MANDNNERKSSFFLAELDDEAGKQLLDLKQSRKQTLRPEPGIDKLVGLVEKVDPEPVVPEVAPKAEEKPKDDWRKCTGLPATDMKQKDWTKYNRKLAYMYPAVILPGWKNISDMK